MGPSGRRVQDLEIERMLACTTVDELDASLLELAFRARLAPSIALWREIAAGTAAAGWRPVRARGPAELQPPQAQVRAVLEGGLDERLADGAVVLTACVGQRRAALVLGGGTWDDDGARADSTVLGSALLALHACLAGSSVQDADFGSVLPRRDDASRAREESDPSD